MRDASPAVKQLIAPSTAAQSRTFGREMHFPQVLQVDVMREECRRRRPFKMGFVKKIRVSRSLASETQNLSDPNPSTITRFP